VVLTVLAVGHGKALSGARREQDGHGKKEEPHRRRPPAAAAPSCWWLHARETTPGELAARGAVLGRPADTATHQQKQKALLGGRSGEQQPPAPQRPNSMMRLMMGCAPNGTKFASP